VASQPRLLFMKRGVAGRRAAQQPATASMVFCSGVFVFGL